MNRLALTRVGLKSCLALACLAWATTQHAVRAADPWADVVVSYMAGANPPVGFSDPNAALGEPTRYTNPTHEFGGIVTPFSSSWGPGETVSIDPGHALTLQFAEPVTNDPLNPFGIDLIVFGNALLKAVFSGSEISTDGIDVEGGVVAVSDDGVTFFDVPGNADGMYPTNAYADIAEPFTATPGLVPADFTRPVDPSFNPIGKTLTQIIAGYGGSGGGLGIDIGPTGLSSISYVRITNPAGSALTPEIDAVADVASIPEPATTTMFFWGALILLGKFSRGVNVKRER